ncbi:MAG: cytochrome P450 [Acidobacteriota bacterium]
MLVSPYLPHRHPGFWTSPNDFDPQRFPPGRRDGVHRFSYFPFGGGPRQCIGNQFGVAEALIILAHLLKDFQLSLPAPRLPPRRLSSRSA